MDKLDTDQLAQSMKHLVDASTDDLKEEVQQDTEPKKEDPKQKEKYGFDFKWKDGRGKLWEGHFVNKILSIAEQQSVGITRAKLAGGMPTSTIDPLTAEINLIISHLTFSLEDKPDWAKDLRKLNNIELLQNLYQEVADHEAMFFGYNDTETNS